MFFHTQTTVFDPEESFPEPSPLELIGYAMNDISEAGRRAYTLPDRFKDTLSCACTMLREVQEYLYDDPLVA